MGMDSYLYRTTKSSADKYEKTKRLIEDIRYANRDRINNATDRLDSMCVTLKKKYHHDNLFMLVHNKELTKEELKKYNALNNELDYLLGYDILRKSKFTSTELMCWRKAYGLHDYIVKHFFNSNPQDNCVRIPLSKDNLIQLKKAMEAKEENFTINGCWSKGIMEETIKKLETVIKSYRKNTVIYYYAWY